MVRVAYSQGPEESMPVSLNLFGSKLLCFIIVVSIILAGVFPSNLIEIFRHAINIIIVP